jgi:hypothetical protein
MLSGTSAGAINLPFTDFTEETLARAIPAKTTRVLIYCNNNFTGAPRAFAAKAASASLNIPRSWHSPRMGILNVYELGPLIEVGRSKLVFEGTEISGSR